jgi:hypothetical protein
MNRNILFGLFATILCFHGISFAESNSADFKLGYVKGFDLGSNHAKGGAGMPLDWALKTMAKIHSQDAKPSNSIDYQNGFEGGFRSGYNSVKPITRNAEDYESLSWINAKPGVKLYDNSEKHEVTIVSIDKPNNIIVVKYIKNGVVAPKDLDALSRYWFVKKQTKLKAK